MSTADDLLRLITALAEAADATPDWMRARLRGMPLGHELARNHVIDHALAHRGTSLRGRHRELAP